MFHIALYAPEIPSETGSIMRLCANTGCTLHLIHPLGFQLDSTKLKRAGLDYRDIATINEYKNYADFLKKLSISSPNSVNLFALTTEVKDSRKYTEVQFQRGDIFLLGSEIRGLPNCILDSLIPEHKLFLPMQKNSRSLNFSNSAAIVMYEALRQHSFAKLA